MIKKLGILALFACVTLALNVQADDYVDDVYFWPYDSQPTHERPTDDPRSANVAKPTVSNTGNDSVRVIEFLPQENDTVVKIRIQNLPAEKTRK